MCGSDTAQASVMPNVTSKFKRKQFVLEGIQTPKPSLSLSTPENTSLSLCLSLCLCLSLSLSPLLRTHFLAVTEPSDSRRWSLHKITVWMVFDTDIDYCLSDESESNSVGCQCTASVLPQRSLGPNSTDAAPTFTSPTLPVGRRRPNWGTVCGSPAHQEQSVNWCSKVVFSWRNI